MAFLRRAKPILRKYHHFRHGVPTGLLSTLAVCSITYDIGGGATASSLAYTNTVAKRTHMNHGNPDLHGIPPVGTSGPRRPMPIGLEATKHTGNVLRLLEASHGSYAFNTVDTLSTVWHPKALCWTYRADDKKWTSMSPMEALSAQENERLRQYTTTTTTSLWMMPQHAISSPRLQSLTFSDDRTALVKLLTGQGSVRYLSMLRLDENTQMNDGWIILREVQVPSSLPSPLYAENATEALASLQRTIRQYLDIEHGGGNSDAKAAEDLFAPQASLLSVGIEDPSQLPSDWSAPVGCLLEIPLETYLAEVQSQMPHDMRSMANDMIVTIDLASGTTVAMAASATVRVGNGTQTLIFEDHLLLGRETNSVGNDCDTEGASWKILCKTFSPQPWPIDHVHHHGKQNHHSHDDHQRHHQDS